MRGERSVGGLWCSEVLALLPDVLAGALSAEQRGAVEAHLAACTVCASFGGHYGEAARRMRVALVDTDESETIDRLKRQLLTGERR